MQPEATRRLLLGGGLWGGLLGALGAIPGVRSARAQQHHTLAMPSSSSPQGGNGGGARHARRHGHCR